METFLRVFQVILLLFVAVQLADAFNKTIYVSPKGKDKQSCGRSDSPCHTIDYAISSARQTGANSTQISAARGSYKLANSFSFKHINNFGLWGQGTKPDDVEIICKGNASLSFVLSNNISVKGVTLQNCGGWRTSSVKAPKPYTGLDGVQFRVALDFRYCRNVQLFNVKISLSPGLGVNFYDVGGVVNFTNCVFADNRAANDNGSKANTQRKSNEEGLHTKQIERVYSGGGIYLALDPYGHNTVNITPSEHDSYQHNNTFVFQNCSFLRNEAVWSNASIAAEFVDTPELPFSRGGGLAVFFRSNASGSTISIDSCLFSGNRASWGGGVNVWMGEKTQNNRLAVENTKFENNKGDQAGGGLRMSNLIKETQQHLNLFTVNNCLFVNNTSVWGGATSIFGSSIPGKCAKHTDADLTQFSFNRCRWTGNTGTVGAAFGAFLKNQNEDQIGPQAPYHTSFNGCTFLRNHVLRLRVLVAIGEGTLYSVEVPLIFRGNMSFLDNSKTAVALDGATVEIYDHVYFINNVGLRGGAMAMYGRSRIIFNKHSYVLFQENKCDTGGQGGALYIDAPGPPLVGFNATGTNTHGCFFAYALPSLDFDDWETKVIFRGNQAPFSSAGNSVFVTTLRGCRRIGEPRQNNSVLRWKFVEFQDQYGKRSSLKDEVATDPVDIQYDTAEWNVAPSERFNATVRLLDELGNSVVGIINVEVIPLHQSSKVSLYPASSMFVANDTISHLAMAGKSGEKFSVELKYMGKQILTQTISGLSLKPCNLGFKQKGSLCVCRDSTERGISRCKSDGKTFYLKHGYWAGTVNNKFVTHFCPTGYCKTVARTPEIKFVSGDMCSDDRDQTSILCGKCKANRAVLFGGEHCSATCSNWYLLLLLLYGLILIAVVMFIMLIDLDFFTGYLNAWLYAYQVMKVITPDGFAFDPFIEFIIGLANFQFKTGSGGICFAAGLDDADKLAIMYVLPTYVLVVAVLLAKAVSYFPNWCFSKKVRAAPIRAVCTIVVLCYTDITRISLRILNPALVGSKIVMYSQGNIGFFTGKHIGFGILAILFIVLFVVPFPMVLLFRPFLTQRLRPVLNLNRWKPIFDALQNCFKDRYRWCAAFYFLARLVIYAIATLVSSGPVKRALLESCCVLILLIIAFLRPYKEAKDVKEDEESYDWINKSDAALLFTLTLIALFSSPFDGMFKSTWSGLRVFVDILAYIPLLVLGMVAIRIIRKYREAKKLREANESELSVSELSEVTDDIVALGNQA